MRTNNAEYGCLIALLVFALLGVLVEYGVNRSATDTDEGGARIGVMGIFGLILFFVIFTVVRLIQFAASKIAPPRDVEQRGFPIESHPREREESDR